MKGAIIFTILLLLALNVASAATTKTFKSGDLIDLKIPCINYGVNYGAYCSSGTTCNITILYPNGTTFINNQLMTYGATYFNYTLPSSDVYGLYTGSMSCNDNGEIGTNPNISFQINSTGDSSNFSFFMLIGLITLIIFGIALYSGNEYIMFISSSLILITGIYGMIYGMGNMNDTFTRIVSFVIIGLGIMFLIISSLKAIAEVSEENTIGGFGPGGEDEYDYFKE